MYVCGIICAFFYDQRQRLIFKPIRSNVIVSGYFSSHSVVMNRDLTGISKQKDGSFVLKFTLTTTEKGITRKVSFK